MNQMTDKHHEYFLPVQLSRNCCFYFLYCAYLLQLDVTHENFSYLNVWLCLATVTCILVLCDKLAISFSGLLTAYKVHRDLAKSLFQSALSSLVTPNARHSLSQVHETNGIKQLQSLCESVATWIHTVVLIITTTVVLAAASPYVLIPALLSFIPEVLILMAYYRTARQFFNLHRFAQSNLQSSVYDFLKGLSIMRAYGREEHMLNILYDRCDARTNILLWKLALNSWLSIRMHLITVFLIMFCGLGLLCEGEDSVTLFGLAGFLFVFLLYYIRDIQLSSVQVIVDGCLSLGSMLKMSEIITVSSSIKDDSGHIPADWPRNGCLSYIDVALQYDTNEHPVLTGATFTVSSGDKFAICGGAGSGKSTLVMALARIPEISHGKVLIDDMDITDVPDSIICSRLTIIPRDAAVLHQTVRYNLCPDGTKSDVDLWTVLEKVELKDIVELFPGQLDQVISEEYMNSTEKQQLFLAYTLLRETCIVVLDDVIRPENTTIRCILDKLFLQDWKHTTVIIVTNQADFLLTTTQTLVLESGCIVEQGHPAALIKKKSPFFPPVNLP